MSSSLIVIIDVALKYSPEVTFTQYDHMVETLSAGGTDYPLRIRILPRRSRRGQNLLDIECCDLASECLTIDRISIPNEESRGIIRPIRLQELSGSPFCRRVLCNVEV